LLQSAAHFCQISTQDSLPHGLVVHLEELFIVEQISDRSNCMYHRITFFQLFAKTLRLQAIALDEVDVSEAGRLRVCVGCLVC